MDTVQLEEILRLCVKYNLRLTKFGEAEFSPVVGETDISQGPIQTTQQDPTYTRLFGGDTPKFNKEK